MRSPQQRRMLRQHQLLQPQQQGHPRLPLLPAAPARAARPSGRPSAPAGTATAASTAAARQCSRRSDPPWSSSASPTPATASSTPTAPTTTILSSIASQASPYTRAKGDRGTVPRTPRRRGNLSHIYNEAKSNDAAKIQQVSFSDFDKPFDKQINVCVQKIHYRKFSSSNLDLFIFNVSK